MAARREGEIGRIVERALLQPRFQFLRVELVSDIGVERHRAEIDRLVGALHGELAVLEVDIGLRRLEHMGGDLLGFRLHLVERPGNGGHADRAGTRAIGAHAELHLVGVAMNDRDIVDGNAKAMRDELGKCRLMPLAVAVRAGEHFHRADRIDPDLGRFPQADTRAERTDRLGRRNAAGFHEGRIAEPAQLAVPGRLAPALAETLHVGHLHGLDEHSFVVAGVVHHDDGRLVRELADEVALSEGRRIDAELARGDLDQPLDHEGRLWAPRAAIGIDRRGVGIDRVDLGIDVRDGILSRQQCRIEIGRHRGGEEREIGAHIGDCLDPDTDDLAVGIGGHFRRRDMVARMGHRQELFRAIGGPFDRPVDLAGRPDADRLLGIDIDLRAEAPADIRRDHPELVLWRDADEGGKHQTRDMRVLARRIERQLIIADIVVANRRPRLHGIGHQAIVDDVELGDVARPGEGGIRRGLVADVPVEDGIAGRLLMHLRRALGLRPAGLRIGGEHLVVDHDRLGRVLGLRQGLGDHHGDMVADIANLALRQHRMGTGAHRRAVLRMDHPAADEPSHLVGRDILAGEDGDHAGHGPGLGGIDALQGRVGMWRAQEIGIGLAGAVDVVGVLALADQKAVVLFAAHGRADAGHSHGVLPQGRARRNDQTEMRGGRAVIRRLVGPRSCPSSPAHPLRRNERCCDSRCIGRYCLRARHGWSARRRRPCGSRYRSPT